MTIGKRVAEALDKYHASDAEAALLPTCVAVDATANKLYGKSGRSSYKEFIKENMLLISKAGINGLQIENLSLAVPAEFVARWPRMEVGDRRICRVEEIFYFVVRCSLVHDAELPPKIVFQSEVKFEVKTDEIRLPSTLIVGLLVAVVACPANSDETIPENYGLNVGGYGLPFNALWGKKDKLWNLYQAMDEIWKGYRPSASAKESIRAGAAVA